MLYLFLVSSLLHILILTQHIHNILTFLRIHLQNWGWLGYGNVMRLWELFHIEWKWNWIEKQSWRVISNKQVTNCEKCWVEYTQHMKIMMILRILQWTQIRLFAFTKSLLNYGHEILFWIHHHHLNLILFV